MTLNHPGSGRGDPTARFFIRAIREIRGYSLGVHRPLAFSRERLKRGLSPILERSKIQLMNGTVPASSISCCPERQSASRGGDVQGANLRTAYYTNNLLNQITGRTVPGYVELLGTAHSNATVTLWAGSDLWASTVRHGEHYRGELRVSNTSLPLWLSLTNVAVLSDGPNPDIVTNTTGNLLLEKTPELFTYDADGNLTRDGKWTYTWDAENRLIGMISCHTNPAVGPQQWLEFGYDAQSRRISKRVGAIGSGNATNTVCFVYDGWNLIGSLNSSFNLLNSFVWGPDLSGTMQGAGGVGGLLWVNDASTLNGQPSTHFVTYDGNENALSLHSASDGSESARYEYGPFGEVIRSTGPMAKANPFRFSTQYQDDETDLLMYVHRPYSPSTGRWLSRDPIEELGGLNLYGFVLNNPISNTDKLGLAVVRAWVQMGNIDPKRC